MSSEDAAGSSHRGRRRRHHRFFTPGSGSEGPLNSSASVKKRKPNTLSVWEQQIIINIHKYVKSIWPEDTYQSNPKMVEKVAEISGVSKSTIYRILATYRDSHAILEKGLMQNKKKSIVEKLDSFEKSAIRRKVHEFLIAGVAPSLDRILKSINEDKQLPNFSRTSLRRVMSYLKFNYVKVGKSALIDSPEIVIWRQKYLGDIQQLRNERQRIFYQDETWVDAGHTAGKVWTDSSGAEKEKGLIVVHIGNEQGFLEGCEWMFESTKTGESMDASDFEEWFGKVVGKLKSGDVIVMNATDRSRRLEKIPTMSSTKLTMQEWLNSKDITFLPSDTKAHLMEKVKAIRNNYKSYVTDEMAKEKGITVVRLPPYHAELNPIQLVWEYVKGYVATKNTTLKIKDVKQLVKEGLSQITSETWKNCVQHVLGVEKDLLGMDDSIDEIADSLLINCKESSSDSEGSDTSEDSEGDYKYNMELL